MPIRPIYFEIIGTHLFGQVLFDKGVSILVGLYRLQVCTGLGFNSFPLTHCFALPCNSSIIASCAVVIKMVICLWSRLAMAFVTSVSFSASLNLSHSAWGLIGLPKSRLRPLTKCIKT